MEHHPEIWDVLWELAVAPLLIKDLNQNKSKVLKDFLKSKVFFLNITLIGIEYYEKNVVNQLLEFMNYYTTEILMEAKIFKDYARLAANESESKKDTSVSLNDVKLAIASKAY